MLYQDHGAENSGDTVDNACVSGLGAVAAGVVEVVGHHRQQQVRLVSRRLGLLRGSQVWSQISADVACGLGFWTQT